MKLPKCKDIPAKFWPPCGSTEQEIVVYRLTMSNYVVCSDDFLSKYELDKRESKINVSLKGIDMYYGLSTFEEIEDAEKLLSKVTAKQYLKGIAMGKTKEGYVKKTPSNHNSHITWWPFEDAKPEEYFLIVSGGKNHE